jgi:hypothetical protein
MTVTEEINIVVTSSQRKADILEMNWKDRNAGDTEPMHPFIHG